MQANQQGQTELLARLVAGQPAQANGVHNPTSHQGRYRQLVDPRGVGKPGILTGTAAENPNQFKTWRIKFANWILAVFPESHAIMRGLEEQTTVEVTAGVFLTMMDENPELVDLSAQLRVTLIAMTEDEPFSLVTKHPKDRTEDWKLIVD